MSRFEFSRRVPGRGVLRILWWDCCRMLVETLMRLFYRLRVDGRERVPRSGPVLFVSNHQSFLDPILNGIAVTDRQFTAIARESLFRFRPAAWLMYSYGAITVANDAGDAGAMKAALGELAAGRCVLIYPEGSRTDDGRLREFHRGVLLLQRRAKVDVLPMGLDGATDVWPRARPIPGLRGRLMVKVGEVIPAAELAELSADEALRRLSRDIDALRRDCRAEIRRASRGRWPSPGPADEPDAAAVGACSP